MNTKSRFSFLFQAGVLSVLLISELLTGRISRAESTAVSASATGSQVAPFVLPDSRGKLVGTGDFSESRCLAIVFLGTECPIANNYIPVLEELQQAYPREKLQIIGINANPSDTAEEIARHVEEFKISFPVLIDSHQEALTLLRVERTCEVLLLDQRRVLRYRGRIDDRFGYSFKKAQPQSHDLRNALDAVLAGQDVAVKQTEVSGCLITRTSQVPAGESVTYASHIAGILNRHCVDCHHPGTAAPFSLTSYEEAKNWSAMIEEVVVDRRMPPWHADPRFSHFSNDRRVSQQEIDALQSWIKAGTPAGDLSQAPPVPSFEDGWRIGKPDIVFQMPKSFTVQAQGEVKYQYFVTPTDFKEDMWMQAGEARPGNRAVVHHIIVFARNPNNHKEMEWLVSTAPGASPTVFPEGLGRKIPKGSELVWQVHYTATGKEEVDLSEVGFVFCKEPPRYHVKNHGIDNHRFSIPPGAENHPVEASYTVPRGAEVMLLAMYPHMHLRGKSFHYYVTFPGEQEQCLLAIPQYDFNWQTGYLLEEPLRLPGGTKIRCVAHYDNSSANPANPDPNSSVGWGDQTWEEMMIGYVDYYVVEPAAAGANNRGRNLLRRLTQ